MSAPEVAKLEQENARLGVALSDAYAVLGKTKTALEQLQAQYDALKQQLDWFKRQLFGQKSEKRLDIDPTEQLNLLAGLGVKAPPSLDDVPTQTVTYERRAKVRDPAVAESGLRFGPEVPVQTIEVTDPAIEAIPDDERKIIGEKVSYRLAQQPGSYVVLKYVRKVVKRLDTKTILTAPARSAADVSFLAAMLVDKFCWHLPLYRQHQRLRDAGITLSRSTLVPSCPGRTALLLRCVPGCGRSLGGEGGVVAKRLVGWRGPPWRCAGRRGTERPGGSSTRPVLVVAQDHPGARASRFLAHIG